jgi:hypothetical protein
VKQHKKLKGRIATTESKANQALNVSAKAWDEIDKLRREKRSIFTQIMYSGIVIILFTLLWDFVASIFNIQHKAGIHGGQVIMIVIGLVITIWGFVRR